MTRSGRNRGDPVGSAGGALKRRIRTFVGLSPHHFGDTEPFLIAVFRLHHPQHHDAAADADGAAAGVVDGAIPFRAVIDDDQIFRLVTRSRSFDVVRSCMSRC